MLHILIMDEQELYPSLVEKLSKDFSLEKESLPAQQDMSLIRSHLIRRIIDLMARSHDLFLNSLYRIDVDESKVRTIMNLKDKTLIPEKLADLIIERQLVRIKTQILYKEGKL